MNDWRKPCEHGWYDKHSYWIEGRRECPGGSPVTVTDLEGEKFWWCETHQAIRFPDSNLCLSGLRDSPLDCRMVERLLIPIPDPQPVTEPTTKITDYDYETEGLGGT